MYSDCPYCYRPKGTWKHDPILLPHGAKYDWISDIELVEVTDEEDRWYKGFQQINEDDIIELQTLLTQLETDNEVSPPTEFSLVNNTGKFQLTGKHIKEMRDSVEKLLIATGITKSDYFNYDEEQNHITHPLGDKLDWADPITEVTDLQKFQVKYIHIEDLRHAITAFWEDFQKEGTASCSSVGDSSGDPHSFTIQKRQFWYGNTGASVEFYNHFMWGSTSQASLGITNVALGQCQAHANAAGYTAGAVQMYQATASGSTSLLALIAVEEGITKFPCSKLVYNPITQLYDTYHLFIKAKCSISLSASGSAIQGDLGYTPVFGPGEKDAWNAAPIVPNNAHTAGAEVTLEIATMYGYGGGGYIIDWIYGVYHNGYTPSSGIPYNLNNFNIDIGQTIIDNYSADPTKLYVTVFSFGCGCGGTGNSLAVKAGQAVELFGFWYGPFYNTGGQGQASASYNIDNINFYYKKVS